MIIKVQKGWILAKKDRCKKIILMLKSIIYHMKMMIKKRE